MKCKKRFIFICLIICLFSIASVCASDANDISLASEDAGQMELSIDNEIIDDNLKANEETVSAETDSEILTDGQYTYSNLREQIGSGGNINLTKGTYTYNNDGDTIEISTSGVINGNGAVIDMTESTIRAFTVSASGVTIKNLTIINANYNGDGGAIYFSSSGTVTNCNFTNNSATYDGGAIRMNSGTVTNCNFINNKQTGRLSVGGAVYFLNNGEVTNCNFTNNTASGSGGAVFFKSNGEVTNCNFTGNTASGDGGAVWIYSGTVTNCNFSNNSASRGGAILSQQWWVVTADTCIFKTDSDTTFNTHNLPPTLNVNNFTTVYGSGEKLTFDLKTNSSIPVTNGNISISVYSNNEWVGNYTCLSGEGWIPDLLVGSYIAVFNTEYAEFQKVNRTVTITMPSDKYYVNVTSLTTNNKTVNITAKTNVPKDIIWEGKLLFILPNGTQIEATYGTNGTWWAEHTFDAYGEYKVNATYVGLDNVTVNNATITVNKIKTELSGNAITTTYNINKDLIITLKDSNGNPVSGAKLIVDLNGAKTYVTDANGQVKVKTKGLTPKTYTAKITFNGDADHDKSTKDVKVTVKKAAPKLTAIAKTFKTTDKTKAYTVILKDNKGRPITNTQVFLKVNGITYKATTNAKGVAAFKIAKLTKQGRYTATITYNGNAGYNKAAKTVQITVKSAFKTVSKGSKDKATVKKIQVALKKNGYYLKFAGHYLKVDGIFHKYTELAVKQFQKAKGLKVTGKVDEKTAKKLGII